MKRFEIQVSWMMATTIEVAAQTREEANRCALTGVRPTDGNFVPFSMNVDSIEEGKSEVSSRKLRRIK